MTLRVAVLGCGPAGLAAAHAANLNGCAVDIFSKKRKSQLYGSQYLHAPLPDVSTNSDEVTVKYVNIGTPEEYRRKTHGDAWDGIVAPEDFQTEHQAWDIRQAYNRLWALYALDIQHLDINGDVGELDTNIKLDSYDLIVSSLPRPIWSTGREFGEKFVNSEGWALGDAPEDGKFVSYAAPENTIICNGTDEVAYTRLSRVHGYTTVEWPSHVKVPIPGVAKIKKPLRYYPGHLRNPANDFMHVGRFGAWEKGVLVTDAFAEVSQVTR